MKPISQKTPYLRKCVNEWLANSKTNEFHVNDISYELTEKYDDLIDLDITKAVSNELIRLERHHKLTSRKGIKGVDSSGVGRPPRVYKKNMIFRISSS